MHHYSVIKCGKSYWTGLSLSFKKLYKNLVIQKKKKLSVYQEEQYNVTLVNALKFQTLLFPFSNKMLVIQKKTLSLPGKTIQCN